ncbi:MAG: hypothetical protein ABMB14_27700 [Myxococcota bacterium]
MAFRHVVGGLVIGAVGLACAGGPAAPTAPTAEAPLEAPVAAPEPARAPRGAPAPQADAECIPKEYACRGNELWRCGGGHWKLVKDCAATDAPYCMLDNEDGGPQFEGHCSTILAACPFVDVYTDAGWVTTGEILRNLNRPALYGSQSLPLPADAVVDGHVILRLAERKPETTYLDAVWLEVGGRRILPVGCSADQPACAIDRVFDELRPGAVRTFEFDVPVGGEPVLWAHGYYLPDRP